LDLEGAAVTVLPRRAPVGNSGPLRGRPLTVFPLGGAAAGPPAGAGTEAGAAVVERIARVRAALPRTDAEIVPAVLQPGDVASVAVFDLLPDEALAVGLALAVASLLHWDGRRARVLP
jgi:hypothetical protein